MLVEGFFYFSINAFFYLVTLPIKACAFTKYFCLYISMTSYIGQKHPAPSVCGP